VCGGATENQLVARSSRMFCRPAGDGGDDDDEATAVRAPPGESGGGGGGAASRRVVAVAPFSVRPTTFQHGLP